MDLLQTIILYARITLFSISALYMLFFFYKAARYPNKSYGLLMVLILILPIFAAAVLELIGLLYKRDGLRQQIYDILNNFASLWIICLAVSHFYILKSFKGKYKEPPFKTFIIGAIFSCIALLGITNLKMFVKWGGQFIMIDFFDIIFLGLISYKTYEFREEIKFGPYSVARESASQLIKSSVIQTSFASLYLIQDIFDAMITCPEISAQNTQEKQSSYCSALNGTRLVIYHCWVLFAVFSNWKMFSMQKETPTRSIANSMITNYMRTSGDGSTFSSDMHL